jgi:hypothetical protein
MRVRLVRVTACSLGLLLLSAAAYLPASAQGTLAPPVGPDSAAPLEQPQQLDQLLAPIALYPDPLLAQILMAATYPLEIVEASRWVQDPNNARLRGDQLDAALQPQDWDPSVKSLVPFPQILQMMDSKLDWTQALGNAFLAQQSDVTASVQRLRAQAQAAGTLQSTAQQTVSTDGQAIVIEPATPQTVYVPYYNPNVVYGGWAYPAYPPVYFPPWPNYGYVAGPGISFGIGFGIVGALWGWDSWDWGHREIHIDHDRFNRINRDADSRHNRPQYTQDTWQHDPEHRRGVPYSAPAVRQKYQPASAGSADARRDFRGFDNRGATHQAGPGPNRGAAPQASPRQAETGRPGAGPQAAGRPESPQSGQRPAEAPRSPQARPPAGPGPQANAHVAPPQQQQQQRRASAPPPAPRPPVQRAVAPAFSSYGRGSDVRAQSQRGQASRQSAPAPAPRSAPPPQRAAAPQQHSAPAPQQHSAPPAAAQRGKKP